LASVVSEKFSDEKIPKMMAFPSEAKFVPMMQQRFHPVAQFCDQSLNAAFHPHSYQQFPQAF